MPDTQQTETPHAFTLSAALSPAEAGEERDGLLAALEAAGEAKTALSLDLDAEKVTPCALQLVVSAHRTAHARQIELVLNDAAATALSTIDLQ